MKSDGINPGSNDQLSPELLLAMHYDMLRIRHVEETIADRYSEQEMRCPVHLSIGQEATAVGVCSSLEKEDKVFSTHRCHAHYLAKGGDLNKMMAEIYGKETGCLGGRGGSMHLADTDVGMELSVPIVASSIPVAVGSSLADKRAGNNKVSVVFIGDGSVEEGVFHESANFAVLHKLPVIFVCENNLYSIYTPLRERQPDRTLTDIGKAHGLTSEGADGNNVSEVYPLAAAAVSRARSGEGPSLLVFDTYRFREHCGPNFDNKLGYQPENEYEQWLERDPVVLSRKALIEGNILDEKAEKARIKEFEAETDAAFEAADKASLPTPDQALAHVYA